MQTPVGHRNACPVAAPATADFGAGVELVFPRRKSAVLQHGVDEAGAPELRVFHGDREISFDEPALFAFAETLVGKDRFVAGDATRWGPGYAWEQVGPLLEALTDAGVLQRAEDAEPDTMEAGLRGSPLPPSRCPRPRDWSECEAIMRELTGRPLELGWLEVVVPVFRVAHIALDADGRQVGEANVFPPALRLDVPTRWRTCLYEGTRHQPDRPINVEALRGMQTHWAQMMAVLARLRSVYLERCPPSGEQLTIAEIERLAVFVLAAPTYQLVRAEAPVANGALHPVLSSLFRVTDGLRMVMHQMLFVPIGEPARDPDARLSAEEIHAYAERNYAFHSEHGVCAGPPHRVVEFLRVFVEGAAPADDPPDALDPEVEAALSEWPQAMDYALLGLQVHAAAFSVWPAMARAYEAIAGVLATMPAGELATRFAGHVHTLKTASYLGEEALRAHRDAVYDEMYAASATALGDAAPAHALANSRRAWRVDLNGQAETVHAALASRLTDDGALEVLTSAILDFAAAAASAIDLAVDAQAGINRLLGRTPPARPFDSDDLDLHNRLQDTQARRVPYLFDELRDALGLALSVTADGLTVGPAPTASFQPHSAAQPSG